eukprot:GHVU01120852.1.p1 GENE.GHVU01120852.1~~GHVU01120852.1.p1  ORF type:complete len:325 (+),score=2.68 GHVU01120852.1:615-1589(+)
MSRPRKQQVFLSETPYYHCVSRCVRRAFLCGSDPITNESFQHRSAWVQERLLFLSSVYTMDICAFAVMSNHFHVVIKIDVETSRSLSDTQVLQRWHKIHKRTLLSRQFCEETPFDDALVPSIKATIKDYRKRLASLSWFMKDLNEHIARLSNAEDGCTGRFWEGRFISQALLDDTSLLACMAYVDLNPIRAKMAINLKDSSYTSIQLRIQSALEGQQPSNLLPFTGAISEDKSNGILFKLDDYLQLVDTTGRCILKDKKGYINSHQQSILTELNISQDNWIAITQHFEEYFKSAVGTPDALIAHTTRSHLKRRPNKSNSKKYFS